MPDNREKTRDVGTGVGRRYECKYLSMNKKKKKKEKTTKKKKKHKDLYRSRMSAEFSLFFLNQEVIMAFEMTKMTSILCMY